MFARLFRFSDRFGKLSVKISLWLSEQLLHTIQFLVGGIKRRDPEHDLDGDTHAEAQVQSLSGLTVILLAAVVVLIFWATNSTGQGASGIQILAFEQGGQAEAADAPPVATQPSAIVQAPEIHSSGTIAFSMWAGNQQDLFALNAGQSAPIRLTDSPADDRDPAWSPDGKRLAFASRRDGNWEIYILEMESGQTTRLTFDTAFEANPTWSPDGLWIAYESYYEGNLDISIYRADASEGPYAVTHQQGPDFDPSWSPDGRSLAYASLRGHTQDIFVISLDDPNDAEALNITNTLTDNEADPVWNTDGTILAYEAVQNGAQVIYSQTLIAGSIPAAIGQGHSPSWSPDGTQVVYFSDDPAGVAPIRSTLFTGHLSEWGGSAPPLAFNLSNIAEDLTWTSAGLPALQAYASTSPPPPAFTEPVAPAPLTGAPYKAMSLPGVTVKDPYLSDRVDWSFMTLRDHINQAVGWDFLGRLDNVWWELDRPLEPGKDERNWHKAGRAFDIVEEYSRGTPAQIELVPEQIGAETYWRMYVRAAIQDGSLGEPLRAAPWDFEARYGGDIDAYNAGGRLRDAIPAGYYVDFTQMALIYGWTRTPSDLAWRSTWSSILFWQYEKHDGIDWWTAMLELYAEDALNAAFSGAQIEPTLSAPANTPAPPALPTSHPTDPPPTAAPTSEPTEPPVGDPPTPSE
jgi:TolB protein